ncbi:MAG: CHASE domain-containing protein [Burkholderiaceae bacterium]
MRRALPHVLAWFVGAITLAFTVGLCLHERESERARLHAIFDLNARQTVDRVEQRMADYEQMLRGVQGLFAAAPGAIDQAAFERYVDRIVAGPDATGLLGVAWLPAARPPAARGAPPPLDPDAGLAAPLRFNAPDSPANRRVRGYDAMSDPTRRAALLQARDSGNPALSGQVQLRVDAGGPAHPGAVMLLAVYAPGADTGDTASRRAALAGWVSIAFRVNDVMSTLYGEQSPGLLLSVYDGADAMPDTLMYRSGPRADADEPAFRTQEFLVFSGHTWTLQMCSLPEFERLHARHASTLILVAGVVLSALLALITHQLVTGRARAYAAAQAMTRELRASEERYRRIVDTAGEGIWLLDAAHRLAYVNPRIVQWLGLPERELLGRAVEDFIPTEDAQACGAVFEAAAADDRSAAIELRLRGADGTTRWVALSLRPIVDDAGRPAGSLGMLTDIDERRRAEERRGALERQLRDAQKMEAIGTLAGGIAHDFNNILAAIIANAATARQDAARGEPVDASLAQVERAAVRARSLVQQILTFSRMQAQELRVQPLQPAVRESLAMLRATLPAQVALDVRLPAEPVHVRADATQVQQVVMNLCTNAWHALVGGEGRIEVGLEAADGWAHLWVADDGTGMDEATRARIFEPFFTTKQVGQGTGLGLAVVHGIVSVHGGTIAVESVPGVGSRFDLRLPLQPAPPPSQPPVADPGPGQDAPPVPPEPRGRGERVLCVDDDPAMVLVMEGLLRRAGYHVTAFDEAPAALAAVADDPAAFELVVTDYNMPGMTGMAFARALARVAPRLPVVITSGFISDDMRQQAAALGVVALVQKEYTLERLAGVVDAALASRRPAGA